MQNQTRDQMAKHNNNNNNKNNEAQKCPRCDSSNTKFCYYNNYSLSQPRYFCKSCRRYWTQGGTLRNVPVGGGSRKAKRPKTAAISPASGTVSSPLSSSSSPANLSSNSHHHHHNHQIGFLSSAQLPQTTFAPASFHGQNNLSSAMSLIQGFSDASSSVQHGQFFINPTNYSSGIGSDQLWNIGGANNAGGSGSSLPPNNQWPDLHGSYGSPPP